MNFLTLKPETFGLDISDLSLKVVKLKKRGKVFSLASFGEQDINHGIIKAGEIRDEAALIKAIKKVLAETKGEKIRTRYVVASLPEEKAFLQIIQLPKMPEQDLRSAVIYEAENYIPLPIEEVYLDFQIVPPVINNLDYFDILITALPRKTIDSYLNCLKKTGLIPRVLEIESLAIARALVKNEVSPFPILLIDLGKTRANFIIFSGYSLRISSSVPIPFQTFDAIISDKLAIDSKKAKQLKIKQGLENKKILEVLNPFLIDLTKQIRKYLDYYQTHTSHEHLLKNGKSVKSVLLSGGGANLKGLTDFLSFEFKIPVQVGNPWVNILPEPLKKVPELSFTDSLRYTAALGLALRGIKYGT